MCIFKTRNWKELKITSALEAETLACVCRAESMDYMHQYQASWVSNVITLGVCIYPWVCVYVCLGDGQLSGGSWGDSGTPVLYEGLAGPAAGRLQLAESPVFPSPFCSVSSHHTCVLRASTLSSLKQRTQYLHDHTLWQEKVCAGYAQSRYS